MIHARARLVQLGKQALSSPHAVALTAIALSGILSVLFLAYFRWQALQSGERTAESLARVVAEQTIRTLQVADQRLQLAQAGITKLQLSGLLNQTSARALLREQLLGMPFVHGIRVIDARGVIAYDSDEGSVGASRADRSFFRHHQAQPQDELFIDEPMLSAGSKQWLISLSRPRLDTDGRLGGVIVASLDPLHFERLWQGMELGPGGTVVLLRRDGLVMIRSPFDAAFLGKRLASLHVLEELASHANGTFTRVSGFDQVERIFSFRVLPDYPDYAVVVGESVSAVLAPWWRFAALALTVWLAGSVVALTLSRRAARERAELRRTELVLRESEHDMSLAQEMAGVGWYVSDLASGQWRGSPTMKRIIGADDSFVYDMAHWQSLIAPEHRQPVQDYFAQVVQTASRFEREYEIIRPVDGQRRWVAALGDFICDAHGQPQILRGTVQDITERKQAEAANALLRAQLLESQKMEAIGTLAGGIAHDFNNIIANILGNSELASEDAQANPVALESLAEIRKAGHRARDLVQQILSFSRRQPLQRKPLDLRAVARESVRLLRATLPPRIAMDLQCPAELPPVLADATQIEQLLINLATNSMQAMRGRQGLVRIVLETVQLDSSLGQNHPELLALCQRHPGRGVRMVVSDNGSGMDAATLSRIFEPFFTTKPPGEGTGLGLSVVLGIVQSHEGAIVATSEPDQGTSFSIYLPVAQEEAISGTATTATRMIPSAGQSLPPAAGACPSLRMLYIDDDESLVFLVTRLLTRRGMRVRGFSDQQQALDSLRADPRAVDLVLTDYNMPGLSGLEVAREVQAIRPDLPVAVVSGFIDETLREAAARAGVRELIFKAADVDVFCASLQGLATPVVASAVGPLPGDKT